MPYLDYAASAPLRAEALAAMLPLLERSGSPSLAVLAGRVGRRAFQQRQHRRQRLRPQGSAGRIVEVRHGRS